MIHPDDWIPLLALPGTALVTLPGQEGAAFALFRNPETVLTARSPEEVKPVFAALEAYLGRGYCGVGFVAYEAAPAFDPAMRVAADGKSPLVCWACYREAPAPVSLPYRNDYRFGDSIRPELEEMEYTARCNEVLDHIAAGNLYQANLTFRVRTRPEPQPERLFLNLVTRHPVPYAAFLNLDEGRKILSFSPELFLETVDGIRLSSGPMKGTAGRGLWTEADREAAERLARDPKNRAENLMIVDMVRNDLGRIARCGSVTVDPLFRVDTYRTVHQMVSAVHGMLPERLPLFDIFQAAFPPASITGAPKIAAMKILAAAEKSPRRVYTGAIGCILPDGAFRFNVAIRTLTCGPDGMETGVGGGIVYDSRPDSEWREALLKCRYASVEMPEFEVFETLGWTRNGGFSRLEEHLARARDSQRYFNRPWFPGRVEAALAGVPAELTGNPVYENGACVKFLLKYDGGVEVKSAPPRRPDWRNLPLRLRLAERRTSSQDTFLYHKTTRREGYDSGFAAAREDGFHEVIFCNEKGELTEGAISNIFIRRGDDWRTPRLECGLLPGLWRAERLAAWSAEECILKPEDLGEADEIRIGNSLRGSGTVTLVVEERTGRVLFSQAPPAVRHEHPGHKIVKK